MTEKTRSNKIKGTGNSMKGKIDLLNKLAEKFDLDIIYAFGSHARDVLNCLKNEDTEIILSPLSDVDIGVKYRVGKDPNIKQKILLGTELENLFNVGRVDLVIISEADPFVAVNIIRGERIYCRDKYMADEYDLYILRRAGDLIPLERERISLIMEGKGL